MFLEFEKWHGCKNDFAIIRISDNDADSVLNSLKKAAPRLCNRDGSGIGADGLLVLQGVQRTSLIPHKLTIINSDGSIAGNCGNGLRCAAGSVLKYCTENGNDHDELPEALELDVEGRKIICRYMTSKGSDQIPLIAVEMGIATVNENVSWHQSAKAEVETLAKTNSISKISGLGDNLGTCEIGNPHIVMFLPKADRELLLKVGPNLQDSKSWDGMNVHLVETSEPTKDDQSVAIQLLGGKISEIHKVFVWERGAGETQACGSGACAVAACSLDSGLASRQDWMAVDMPGGRLFIKQDDPSDPVTMAGPAKFVYSGEIEF